MNNISSQSLIEMDTQGWLCPSWLAQCHTKPNTYNNHVQDIGLHTMKDMELSKKHGTSNVIYRLMQVKCDCLSELQTDCDQGE
jgi:hypothetical protein